MKHLELQRQLTFVLWSIPQDGVGTFDFIEIIRDLLNDQILADYTITYYLNQNDANTGMPVP
jgi:hypothetical protein